MPTTPQSTLSAPEGRGKRGEGGGRMDRRTVLDTQREEERHGYENAVVLTEEEKAESCGHGRKWKSATALEVRNGKIF